MHRRSRALPVIAACLATAATASGCGGGHGDHPDADATPSRAVAATVQRAFAALADDRGAVFCEILTASARRTLTRRGHASCERVVTLVSTRLDRRQRAALRHLRVGAPAINGARATVRDRSLTATRGGLTGFIGAAPDGATHLRRGHDGRWRISG